MSKEKKVNNSLSLEELSAKVTEINAQLFKLRMQQATGQLGNTASLRMTRKELARMKTFITQKSSKKGAERAVKGKRV